MVARNTMLPSSFVYHCTSPLVAAICSCDLFGVAMLPSTVHLPVPPTASFFPICFFLALQLRLVVCRVSLVPFRGPASAGLLSSPRDSSSQRPKRRLELCLRRDSDQGHRHYSRDLRLLFLLSAVVTRGPSSSYSSAAWVFIVTAAPSRSLVAATV